MFPYACKMGLEGICRSARIRSTAPAARQTGSSPRPRHYRPWRTNVSLVFSIRRMLLESSAAAPSNETRIAQAAGG